MNQNTAPRTVTPRNNGKAPEVLPPEPENKPDEMADTDAPGMGNAPPEPVAEIEPTPEPAPEASMEIDPSAVVPSQLDPNPPEADFSRLEMDTVKSAIIILAGYVSPGAASHIANVLYPQTGDTMTIPLPGPDLSQ